MAKPKKPTYLHHKPSGQARVRIDGKDFYLGPYGSPESYSRYDELVTKWLRKLSFDRHLLTVDELVLLYLDYTVDYYGNHGDRSTEVIKFRSSLRPVVELFGRTRACEFGPLALKRVREEIVKKGVARRTVNDRVFRIRRMFAWAIENEHVPANEMILALDKVKSLARGKTTAPDLPPVLPVADAVVDATIPHLSPIVADMIRLQRLTGMRPAEVCLLRPCDVERTAETWKYVPSEHKTEHHGKQRVIFIGPRGQDVLRPYLLRAAEAFCFSPAESEIKRRRARSERRLTPMSCGNCPGSNVKDDPKRSAGDRYITASYRRAIERACDKAFPIPPELRVPRNVALPEAEAKRRKDAAKAWRLSKRWSPNQLRHAAATEIRRRFGLEAAQVSLGHSEANTTQIYAERDMEKAAAVMREIG